MLPCILKPFLCWINQIWVFRIFTIQIFYSKNTLFAGLNQKELGIVQRSWMETAFWKHEFEYDHHLIHSMAAATMATATSYIVWKVTGVFGIFMVRIFPHLDWIWRDTEYLWGKIGTKKTPNMDTFHAVL